jgi:hypothetical protein
MSLDGLLFKWVVHLSVFFIEPAKHFGEVCDSDAGVTTD